MFTQIFCQVECSRDLFKWSCFQDFSTALDLTVVILITFVMGLIGHNYLSFLRRQEST